jgi:hypothetical protein
VTTPTEHTEPTTSTTPASDDPEGGLRDRARHDWTVDVLAVPLSGDGSPESLLRQVLVMALTELNWQRTGQTDDQRAQTDALEASGWTAVTARLTFNGQPVPVEQFFARLPDWVKTVAYAYAHDLLGGLTELRELSELVDEATSDVRTRVHELLRAAGIPPRSDDV